MNGPLETGDMMVVTVRVPTRDAAQLAVSVGDGIIQVLGPDGFLHEVPLPTGADPDRLHAELFHETLELRAPRTNAAGTSEARRLPVRPLT